MNHSTRVIAIDLAKNSFQVCLFDQHMRVLSNKPLGRKALSQFLARQRPARVAMEACGGAHHWGRKAQAFGHEVVILPPKQVNPYRQGQKHDSNDALAIGIASQQPQLKTVGLKTLDQQSLQCDKRVQEHLSDQLTATGNVLRALVAEFGLVIPRGVAALRRQLPRILEDAENGLPDGVRESLWLVWQQWQGQAELLAQAERLLARRVHSVEPCQRLMALEGIGEKNAVGVYLRVGNGQHFKNGREASACVGITPQQHSTGGKVHMGGIGKYRGDQRLRASLIVGCRSAVNALAHRAPRNAREVWLKALIERRGPGRAAVALANKNVRCAWAMLHNNTAYTPEPITAA